MQEQTFTLFADYFQFYIQDEAVDGDLSEAWSAEAESRMLAVAPGTVGIGTVRNMDVPVTIQVFSSEPTLRLHEWDHVVECSISIESGQLVVAGCTDFFPDAARISLTPALYRVRACLTGLTTLSADGLDGDDCYHLQLWPAEAIEPTVLKQRAA